VEIIDTSLISSMCKNKSHPYARSRVYARRMHRERTWPARQTGNRRGCGPSGPEEMERTCESRN